MSWVSVKNRKPEVQAGERPEFIIFDGAAPSLSFTHPNLWNRKHGPKVTHWCYAKPRLVDQINGDENMKEEVVVLEPVAVRRQTAARNRITVERKKKNEMDSQEKEIHSLSYSVYDVKGKLSALLALASMGVPIIITRCRKPIARLIPYESPPESAGMAKPLESKSSSRRLSEEIERKQIELEKLKQIAYECRAKQG